MSGTSVFENQNGPETTAVCGVHPGRSGEFVVGMTGFEPGTSTVSW